MYENMTYEYILQKMLDRVPNTIDKREGSVIYDALAPAAAEMAQIYIELNIRYNLYFIETSTGEYLSQRTAEVGVKRKPATKAIRKGLFFNSNNTLFDIPIGSRYSIDNLNYIAVNKLSTGEFEMECERVGIVGNQKFGELIPIDFVDGLAKAELADVLIPGEDDESDENLRERYYEKIRTPATSGNKYHYKNWAKEVIGVGDAHIIPLWNGNNTVKVIIVDSEKNPASDYLVQKTFDHIEEERPIGARVTVVSAQAKNINISAKLNLANKYTIQNVQREFENTLEKYRKDIAFKDSYISYAAIGNLLFNTHGVLDYNNLNLNGVMKNIGLEDEEIPIFNTIQLEVM
ncbi:baseplate J/gp47 family protein [Anaerophilus nitritogenes]|uniref:baseplate J/gp47 family protein n=1 Tax=Anaerophilus nitritogenes TaxID=2498136 RepID=UPI00101D61D8|nr:baseplate J/gp47 family protein [Anaerophilus nitritogenes]